MSVKEPLNGGTAYVPPPDDNFVWYKADNERLRGLIRHILGDRITPEAYLLYGKAWVDEAHAALAAPRPEPEPEPVPEPATDAKLLLAYRQRGCGFYMEFKEIWQAAERFHGIVKEVQP